MHENKIFSKKKNDKAVKKLKSSEEMINFSWLILLNENMMHYLLSGRKKCIVSQEPTQNLPPNVNNFLIFHMFCFRDPNFPPNIKISQEPGSTFFPALFVAQVLRSFIL